MMHTIICIFLYCYCIGLLTYLLGDHVFNHTYPTTTRRIKDSSHITILRNAMLYLCPNIVVYIMICSLSVCYCFFHRKQAVIY